MKDPHIEVEKLKAEASQLLNRMFSILPGFESDTVKRIVDCIVSAAILETAAIQAEAINRHGEEKYRCRE